MTLVRSAAVLAVSMFAVLACDKTENKATPPATSQEPGPGGSAAASTGAVDLDKAQTVFKERCAACHGSEGKGNGPASAALNPKPRNYADKAWQASVTDEQLRKAITLGGAGVGKSPSMPASPDLGDKPDVVEGLVKIIRKFGS